MKILFIYIGLASLKLMRISLILLWMLPSLSLAENLNITLIPSSSSDTYTITADHIKNTIDKTNANSIQTRIITIEELYTLRDSLSSKTDLFVPIGQRALKETLKYSSETPILSSLISKYNFDNIITNRNKSDNENVGAIYIDQPISRHISFSRLALPNLKNPGFIISNSNKFTSDRLNIIGNNSYHIAILNPGDNVISLLSHVINDSDVIIALPDPIIFNLRTTRNILLSTYRKRIPLIGFSESYAKAGALAAIYSTPDLIGRQTGEIIVDLVNNSAFKNKSYSLPRLSSKYFSISVNNRVSRSLGLPALDADGLRKKLLLIEARNHE